MILIIYWILGYWATGVVLYRNKVVVYTEGALFSKKLIYGLVFGWLFIPIAILKSLLGSR